MSHITRKLELKPISKNFITAGGYRGVLPDREAMSYDDVIDEVLKHSFLRIEPNTLKMIISQTFETIIAGTLKDGRTRRLGDYCMVQLEVRGKFDSPGEQFDEKKHKLVLKLTPLKAFRRKRGKDDVAVYNRNAGPQVVIDGVTSASIGESGMIKFGEDLIVTGKNLFMIDNVGDEVHDEITVKYFSVHGHTWVTIPGSEATVNDEGTQLVIPWDQTVGEIIRSNPEKFDPKTNPPMSVMVALRSRGGEATARQQLHRGKAIFETYSAAHKGLTVDAMTIVWGSI